MKQGLHGPCFGCPFFLLLLLLCTGSITGAILRAHPLVASAIAGAVAVSIAHSGPRTVTGAVMGTDSLISSAIAGAVTVSLSLSHPETGMSLRSRGGAGAGADGCIGPGSHGRIRARA